MKAGIFSFLSKLIITSALKITAQLKCMTFPSPKYHMLSSSHWLEGLTLSKEDKPEVNVQKQSLSCQSKMLAHQDLLPNICNARDPLISYLHVSERRQ